MESIFACRIVSSSFPLFLFFSCDFLIPRLGNMSVLWNFFFIWQTCDEDFSESQSTTTGSSEVPTEDNDLEEKVYAPLQ